VGQNSAIAEVQTLGAMKLNPIQQSSKRQTMCVIKCVSIASSKTKQQRMWAHNLLCSLHVRRDAARQ
jgi:hypothetical protein